MPEHRLDTAPSSAVMIERAGRFFFYQPETGVVASGASLEGAFEDFSRKRTLHAEEVALAGILIERAPAAVEGGPLRRDLKGELVLFLAKFCVVIVVLAVAAVIVVSAISGAAQKIVATLAPLGAISMRDAADKAELMARDIREMPPERKDALRRSIAVISREVEPYVEAWRNPATAAGTPGSPKP